MADETTTTHETATPRETIVIRDNPSAGSGMGWLLGLIVILALIAGLFLFSQANQSEAVKDNAIANAANNVGAAAQDVGAAAKGAADTLGKQ
ncbi:MAG: hypothetical protein FP826_09585 [Sphingomonadales bacterium]|nr:hypothetical protein [Sphingomonadales bacterium]MBU3991902.1 hypothetical protein [Alphaproteobacteria bacterium]